MISAKEALLNLSILHKGEINAIIADINKGYNPTDNNVVVGMDYITILDTEYPARLKETYMPPVVLFYKGNLDLLKDEDTLSVIACKEHEDNFDNVANYLLKDTKKTLVLGGNPISDNLLVRLAKKVILVLPCGIKAKNDTYLTLVDCVINNGGLVISEYPNDTPTDVSHCLSRNRIIEGLAAKTLVLESLKNGATGTTRINYATLLSHEVLVVPMPIVADKYANNELLSEGALVCVKRWQIDG